MMICIWDIEDFVIYLWCRYWFFFWYCLGILSFVSDSFFFFLPHSLNVFFCLRDAPRELRMEGKRQGYLLTQTLFYGLTNILWCGTFSCNNRNSYVSKTRCWNILESFLVSYKFSKVYLAEVAASRRHSWHQSRDLMSTCTTLLADEAKRSFQ